MTATLLCLFGQASALLHGVLVEHAHCAEHGEAVHVASAEHAREHVAHGDASDSGAPMVQADATTAEAHEHEHCLGVWDRRGITLPPETGTMVPALPASGVQATPHLIAGVARHPLLLLAPKTSPPV